MRDSNGVPLTRVASTPSTGQYSVSAGVYTHAGPEIAVASTKAFLTQIVAVYVFALYFAQVRGNMYGEEINHLIAQVADMPQKVDLVLDTTEPVRALARKFKDSSSVLFLGRHVGFPVALEGALKLKELAYMHAEGFAAGELKHGPIALLDAAASGGLSTSAGVLAQAKRMLASQAVESCS